MATGWRYSVRIPDYTKEETQGEDDVVYYQVDVLVQPPGSSEPSAPSTVWRRFSEFRQLHTNLKTALPTLFKSKDLDPPPKKSLRFVNNSEKLLNERRQGLETWLWALMSRREIAQSREMRAFLQLHLAVRAATSTGAMSPATPDHRAGEFDPTSFAGSEVTEGEVDTVSEASGPSVITTISNIPTENMSMGMPTRSQMGDVAEALRMGLRVEQRSDLKKLLGIINHYIDQAGRDLQESSAEVSRLQQANRELIERTHSLEAQVQGDNSPHDTSTLELQQILEHKDASLCEAQSRVKELEASVSSMEAHCSGLESKLEEAAQAHQLSGKELEERAARLAQDLQSSEKRCAGLEQDLAEWKRKYKEDNRKLAEAVRALRGEKADFDTKISKLEEGLANARDEKDEVVARLQGKVHALEQKLAQEQHERSAWEAEHVGKLEASLNSALAVSEGLRTEHRKVLSWLDTMQGTLCDVDNTETLLLERLNSFAQGMKEEKGALEARLAAAGTKCQEMEQRVAVLEGCSVAAEELESLQRQHDALLVAHGDIEKQLADKCHDVEELQRVKVELEQLQSSYREVAAERDAALSAHEKLKEVNGKVRGLGEEVGSLRSENQLLRQHSAKSARLTSDLELVMGENKSLKEKLEQKEVDSREVVGLRNELVDLKAANSALTRVEGEMKQHLVELEAKLREQAAMEQEIASLRMSNDRCETLSKEVELLKSKLRDASADNGSHLGPVAVQLDRVLAENEQLKQRNRELGTQNKVLTSRRSEPGELETLKAQLADSNKLVQELREQFRAVGLEREQLAAAQESTSQALLQAQADSIQATNKISELQNAVERLTAASAAASELKSPAGDAGLDVTSSDTGDMHQPGQHDKEFIQKISCEVREIFSQLIGCDVSGLPVDGSVDPTALDGFLERVGQSNGQLTLIETRTRDLRDGQAAATLDDRPVALDLRLALADVLDELARKYKKINEITVQRLLASFEASSALQSPSGHTSNVPSSPTQSIPIPAAHQSRQAQAVRKQPQRTWTRGTPEQTSPRAIRSTRSVGSYDELAGGYQRLPGRTTSAASAESTGGGPQDPSSPEGSGTGVRGFLGGLAKMGQSSGFMQKMSSSFINRAGQAPQQQRQGPAQRVQSEQSPPG
ncbi:unnamed protein product [Ostreobium quekettii]|uniref:PX domain-containing protein n=1 Tax=Ostreobium quekettii TaxID=121088 RepID=A0A8S1J0S5_9CHLO|nr:unnamed protein product [Ostreobium quekettii]|eukprot:evm.model.scf_1302.3 EVM.evm.TU.scf_1302.3   scf_1302:7608-13291(-)